MLNENVASRALFTNANDGTNEGIVSSALPVFSVQFHPEHSAGPEDLERLFDDFLALVGDKKKRRGAAEAVAEAINGQFAPPARDQSCCDHGQTRGVPRSREFCCYLVKISISLFSVLILSLCVESRACVCLCVHYVCHASVSWVCENICDGDDNFGGGGWINQCNDCCGSW